MSLTTLDKEHNCTPTRVISLEVTDPDGEGRLRLGQVYTRDSLSIDPRNMVTADTMARWSHLKGLPLHHAPSDEVMLLIGQDYPDALIPLATVPRRKGEPYAVKTRLGWTVNGPVASRKTPMEQQTFFTQGERFEQLNQKLERFWKLESSGLYEDDRAMSVQDKLVTARWEDAAVYDDGHYTLPIPFWHEEPRLSDNKKMAQTRLNSLRKELEKDAKLREKYTEGRQDLLAKGIAIEVPPAEIGQQNGMTNKLIGMLTRFRLRQIALMADVEAMFRQVRVGASNQDVLRFLWWPRGDTDEAPRTYRMTVCLFGWTWSPSCCTYAVHRTVQDNAHQFSEAACETAKRNFYVNDCLKSVSTVEEAIALTKELKDLLARGGFNLTKWTSNHPAVLEEIPSHDQSKKANERSIDAPMEERALGVYWNMEEDYLGYRTQSMSKTLTKRGLLSMLGSIYDPLGLASPFILGARRIVQDLCRGKTAWDERIGRSNGHGG